MKPAAHPKVAAAFAPQLPSVPNGDADCPLLPSGENCVNGNVDKLSKAVFRAAKRSSGTLPCDRVPV